jgi:hypothetical protein
MTPMQSAGSSSGPAPSASPGNMAVTLNCSFQVEPGKTLKVKARIANPGSSHVYVFNRLWDLDPTNKPIEDPEKMYRFIRDSELRLLLGPAPLPRLKTVTFKNIPYATLIKPGGSVDIETSFPVPATEYSVYFPETPGNKSTISRINRVALFVRVVETKATFETTAAPFDPAALKIEVPGVLDSARIVSCHSTPVGLDALRRADEFDRLTLPGEAAEPLNLR